MKKVLIITLAVLVTMSFACGKKDAEKGSGEASSEVTFEPTGFDECDAALSFYIACYTGMPGMTNENIKMIVDQQRKGYLKAATGPDAAKLVAGMCRNTEKQYRSMDQCKAVAAKIPMAAEKEPELLPTGIPECDTAVQVYYKTNMEKLKQMGGMATTSAAMTANALGQKWSEQAADPKKAKKAARECKMLTKMEIKKYCENEASEDHRDEYCKK